MVQQQTHRTHQAVLTPKQARQQQPIATVAAAAAAEAHLLPQLSECHPGRHAVHPDAQLGPFTPQARRQLVDSSLTNGIQAA
jgi:hypothetical protein